MHKTGSSISDRWDDVESFEPLPQGDWESEFRDFVFKHIIWGNHKHPRVCLKYPVGYKWENSDPYSIKPLPVGSLLFVPTSPIQDYDVITSLTLKDWNADPSLHEKHLPMFDLDFMGRFRFAKCKPAANLTNVRCEISGLVDKHGYEMQFPAINTDTWGSENSNIGLMFVSGSGHFHFFGNSGLSRDSFQENLIAVNKVNPSWAWASGQSGFFALRPPFRPKRYFPTMPYNFVNAKVILENTYLMNEYKYQNAYWMGCPFTDAPAPLGWWVMDEKPFESMRRDILMSKLTVDSLPNPVKPEPEEHSHIKAMMLKEAERILEARNARN